MTFFYSVIFNKAITIPITTWFISQLIKVILYKFRKGKIKLSRFLESGGMPSSHSAFVVSLAIVVGKKPRWQSYEFGFTVILALIVMYNVSEIDKAIGEHAEVLNKLLGNNTF